jgi:hypothetical protein
VREQCTTITNELKLKRKMLIVPGNESHNVRNEELEPAD